MKKLISLLLSGTLTLSLCMGAAWAGNVPTPVNQVCTQEEWEVLKLTNQTRLAEGLPPLSTFAALQTVAGVREQELVSLYSHSRPNGSECFTALSEGGLGYSSAGENIAAGQSSANTVVKAWIGSEGHRQNILDAKFTHMGVGYTSKSCTIVTETGTGQIRNGWVQLFLSDNCSITSISLSRQTAACQPGGTLDALDLYVEATCSVHGACYLPLLSGMCTGFDPDLTGPQTVTVTYAGQTAQLQVQVTSDLLDTSSADGWAVNWLERANALELLSERNRAQFTSNVTRLQFADLAVTLAEQLTGSAIVPAADNAFTDTSEEVILKAKAAGIAGGYEANGVYEFRSGNPISRQEICVMLAHVVDYVTAHQAAPAQLDRSETINGSFPDAGQVESWAVKQVALMTNNNIMGGKATDSGAVISPKAETTLQEAVTLIVKLYDSLH